MSERLIGACRHSKRTLTCPAKVPYYHKIFFADELYFLQTTDELSIVSSCTEDKLLLFTDAELT